MNMPVLKEPQKQIPGGFQFLQPETGWNRPVFLADSIVKQLIKHRQGQLYLVHKNGWAMDPAQVLDEVKAYNVAVCVQNGWNDYLLGGSEAIVPFPTTQPGLLQRARRVAAGASTIVSWRAYGAPTVPQELANKRAGICTGGDDPAKKCPMNGSGGLEAYFTVPAANAIRAEVEHKKKMARNAIGRTPWRTAAIARCLWSGVDRILSKMPADQQAALHPTGLRTAMPECFMENRIVGGGGNGIPGRKPARR
jgi:hypothetical protein